jgi:hypothetical protein
VCVMWPWVGRVRDGARVFAKLGSLAVGRHLVPPPNGTELQGMQGTCPCVLLAVGAAVPGHMGPGGEVCCLEAAMGGVEHHTHGDQEGARIHIHSCWEGVVVCVWRRGEGARQQWCTASCWEASQLGWVLPSSRVCQPASKVAAVLSGRVFRSHMCGGAGSVCAS